MNCSKMQELLSAYANDQLALTQREFVEEHLTVCASCQRVLTDYQALRIQLKSLQTTKITPDIRESTMSRLGGVRIFSVPMPDQKFLRPSLVIVAIAVVAVAALSFRFSGGSTVGGVEAAYAATEALQSYRISGSNIVSMNDQSSEVGFSWAFTDKNRYHGMIFENGQTEEFIIVGEDQYRRVTVDNRSSSTFIDESGEGGVNIFSPFPGKRDTLGLLNSLVDIRDLPDTVVGGVQTTHHRGRVDIDKLRSHAIALDPLAGDFRDNLEALGIPAIDYQEALEFLGAPRKIIVNVDLWISKDEFHIRQMKLSGAAAATSSGGVEQIGGITWDTTVKFSDFNETINIERPLIASGNVQSYWRLSERRPFYSNIETEKR